MPEQLTIDGRSVPYPTPTPRPLTARQRELLRTMRWLGRAVPNGAVREFYADPHGALLRLERLGLVERARRGWWRAT